MSNPRPEHPTLASRILWTSLALGCLSVLVVAAFLVPDARGYGTHTQLGLPPCGFLTWTGAPCPGCGLTTSFALGIRGRWASAFDANPLGLALFLLTCLGIPFGLAGAFRGWSLEAAVDRFALHRWALAMAACAAVLWVARLSAAL